MGLSGLLRRGVEPGLLLNWERLEGRSELPTTNVDSDFCNDWKPKLKSDRTDAKPLLKSDRTDTKPLSSVGTKVLSPLPMTLHSAVKFLITFTIDPSRLEDVLSLFLQFGDEDPLGDELPFPLQFGESEPDGDEVKRLLLLQLGEPL